MASFTLVPVEDTKQSAAPTSKFTLVPVNEPRQPQEQQYKFSDPLSIAEPYVPTKEELAAQPKTEPQIPAPMRSELTEQEQNYQRQQIPFQRVMEQVRPLQGQRTNAPLPPPRPSAYQQQANGVQQPIIVNPLLGAGESTIGQIKGSKNPETGEEYPYQPTKEEIARAKAAGVPVMQMLEGEAKEDLPFRTSGKLAPTQEEPGRVMAAETAERRAEANQNYDETLQKMTENKKALEDRLQRYRDQYAAGKIKKTDLDAHERVIGRTIEDAQGEIDKARADKIKWAQQAITQSGFNAAVQRFPQAIAEQGADTATAVARIATSPVSLMEYLVYGDKIDPKLEIQNAISKQDADMKKAIRTQFNADAARAEDLGQQVVQGVASTAAFALTGAGLTKGFQLSLPVATAVGGALPQAAQMWQAAEQRAQEDPSVNQNWRKWTTFTLGLGIGATEALPISRFFERLEHASGGGLTRWLGMVAASSGEEGVQEGLQQLLQNAVQMHLLNDPDTTLTKDVANNMLVGSLSGALFSGTVGGAHMGYEAFRNAGKQQLPPQMMPPTIAPFNLQSPFVAQAQQQAPASPVSPTPQREAVEAQGAVTPPPPAAPTVSKEDAETLKGAGYSVADILEMSPAEVAAELKDAKEAGAKPIALSASEQNEISPPAPSEAAVQLVQQGVPPLQAIAEVGAQKQPEVKEEVAPAAPAEPIAPIVAPEPVAPIVSPEVKAAQDELKKIEDAKNLLEAYKKSSFDAEGNRITATALRDAEQVLQNTPPERIAELQEKINPKPPAPEKVEQKGEYQKTPLTTAVRKLGGINDPDFKQLESMGLYNKNGISPDDAITRLVEMGFYPDLKDQAIGKNEIDRLFSDLSSPRRIYPEGVAPPQKKVDKAEKEAFLAQREKDREDLYQFMRDEAISHDDESVKDALDFMAIGHNPEDAWHLAVQKQNNDAGVIQKSDFNTDDDYDKLLEEFDNARHSQAVQGMGPEGRALSEQGAKPEQKEEAERAGEEKQAVSPVSVEQGAEGKPQLVIPGAEKISQAEQAQRGAEKPLAPKVEQKEPDGLFGESSKQQDLMDLVKQEDKADKNKPVRRLETLSDAFQQRLKGEGFKSIAEARKIAKELTGTEDNKLIEESMELALVKEAMEIVGQNLTTDEKYDRLLDLYNKQPKLETRTSESIKNQAYSTPLPLAFVASRLAGINKDVTVLEPTAGNGALVMEANPKKTVVNEINRVRRENLEALGFEPKKQDASDPAFVDGKFDVVIANPPFGTVKTEQGDTKSFDMDWIQYGYNTSEIDHAITFATLDKMKKNGRGAFIIGSVSPLATTEKARSDAYNAKAKREFFLTLYKNYNVVDHFTVAGKLYERQGAAWPVDVLVIDGEGKSALPLPAVKPPRVLNTWDDVKGELKNEVTGAVSAAPAQAIQSAEPRPAGIREEPNRKPAVVEQPPVGESSVRSDRGVSEEGGIEQPIPSPQSAELAERAKREQSERLDELVAPSPVRVGKQETETERQVAYAPKSEKTQGLGTLVPVNMRQSISDALQRIQDKHGSIDNYVADRLNYPVNSLSKYFSAEQVDAIGLAIDNFEKNAGFIIGDQTGIGKGRVNAAIIRYAINNNKIPIFVTEKPNLYGDMYRDMNDIGINQVTSGKEPKILITNASGNVPLDIEAGKYLKTGDAKSHNALLDRLAKNGKIGDYDMVFTTYSQMQTLKGKETERQRFLKAIAPNAILILDESHNAGGSGGSTDAAEGQGMNRAQYVRDLVGNSSATFYSSATYAKRPDVMDLYYKTDMSKAVDSPDALAEAISKGGVPMQQIVATMLARAGQYIRRERSFAGVRYDAPVVPVNRETYDNFSNAISQIQKFSKAIKVATKRMDEELKAEAKGSSPDRSTGGAGAESSNFTSVLHNLINQMLLASKVEPAVKEAIESLKNGEKPVFTVANTMESFLNNVAEEEGLATGSPINLDFGNLLNRYLDRTRTIIIREPFTKGSVRHYLTDEELGPQVTAFYKSIQNYIDSLDFSGMPISPIDYIRNQMEKAGYKVGEITGRGTTVNYSGPVPTLSSRSSAETGAKGRIKTINDFNNGTIDAIILNQAGATGLSLHASEKFKDQRPRNMIIVQPEGNIDTHMQMLGRVHRTGQVVVPRYTQLIADIPAEKRPAAVLQKKMASLSANTTASRKGALQAENVPDFINEYGDHVAGQFLIDNPDLQIALDVAVSEPKEGLGADNADLMRKLTGRIPLLPLSQQEEVYSELEARYSDMMAQLEAQGINTLEAKNLDLDARPIETRVVKEGDSSSPFTEPVNYTVYDIKKQGKPISASDAIDRVAAAQKSEIAAGDNPIRALEQMQTAFEQSHLATVKAAKEEFRSYERAILDDTAPENLEKESSRLGLVRSAFEDAADILIPGRRIRLQLQNGETYQGLVINFAKKGKSKNPLALGSWEAAIAYPSSNPIMNIPLSQIQIGGESDSKTSIARVGWADTPESLIKSFDDLATSGMREKRIIATGNLLSGFDALSGKGQIINFTDADGVVRQGIMLPSRIKTMDEAVGQSKAVIKTPEEMIVALTTSPTNTVTSTNNDLMLQYNPRFKEYTIITPRAKDKGGKYYLDNKMMQITGGFTSSGRSNMSTKVYSSNIKEAVQRLLDLGARFETSNEAVRSASMNLTPATVRRGVSQVENITKNVYDIAQRVVGNLAEVSMRPLTENDVTVEEARKSGLVGDLRAPAGITSREQGAIRMVVSSLLDPLSTTATTYHEADHVLDMAGAFTPQEIRMREIAAPRLRNFLLSNGYTQESIQQMPLHELLAYSNELYGLYTDAGVNPNQIHLPGAMRRMFDKVLKFIEGVRNWLAGNGYKNIESLMRNQYVGEIARRAMNEANQIGKQLQQERAFSFGNEAINKINAMNQANGMKVKAAKKPTATFVAPAYGKIAEATRLLQDEFTYLRSVQQEIELGRGSPLPDTLNAYMAQSLLPGRISERLETFRDKEAKPIIDFMKENNISKDDLDLFLLAKHAPERNAEMAKRDPSRFGNDGGSGILNKTADDLIQEFRDAGKEATLEKAAQMVYDIIRADNKRRLDSGLIDQATYDSYENYKYYVPLRGFAERDAEEDNLIPHIGRGITVSGKEFKTALGRGSISGSPLANAIMQAEEGIYRVEKNRAAKALLRLAQANPNDELWQVNKLPKKRIIGEDGLVKYVPDMSQRYGDNIVVAKVGGRTNFIILKNVPLAQAYRKLGASQLGPYMAKIAEVGRFFSQLATTRNPAFFIPNVTRDFQEALFSAFNESPEMAKKFLANYPAAMATAIRVAGGTATPQQLGIYDQWRLSGGKISYNSFREMETIAKEIERLVGGVDPLTWSNLPQKAKDNTLGVIKKALGAIDKISEPLENATRLAVFMAAKDVGYSDQKASSLARESTVNFNRRGAWGSAINGLYMFYNANVQGSAKMLELLSRKDAVGKRARAVYASLVPLGFFMTLMNLAVSGNDPADKWKKNYSNIPEYIRRGYFVVKTGPNEKDYIRILPLAFALKIPYYLGEQMAMVLTGQVKPLTAANNVMMNTIDAFNPLGSGSIWNMLMPSLVDPFFEMYSNKALPTEAPIVPKETEYNKGVPHSQQYFTTNTQASISIASFLNEITGGSKVIPGNLDIYPGWIDYSAKWMTGGLGSSVSGLYNWAKNSIEGTPTPAEKIPIVKGFAPAGGGEGRRYYELHDEVDKKVNELRNAKRQLELNPKDEKVRADFRALGKELGASIENGKIVWKQGPVGAMEKSDKAIAELRKQASSIRANDKLSAVDRKQKLDSIDARIENVMVKTRGVLNRVVPEKKPTFAPLSNLVQ